MSDSDKRLLGIAAIAIFAFVGVLLLSFAVWLAAESIAVIRTHEQARAEVVRSERLGSGSSRMSFYAVLVRYDGPRGRRTARVDRTTSAYEPGEIMTIYYKPETAHKAVAGGFMSMWSLSAFLGVLGLGMLGGALFGLWPMNPRRSPTST